MSIKLSIGSGRELPPPMCPICGDLMATPSAFPYIMRGVAKKDAEPCHSYYCHGLQICFCDNCISGEGGVGIVCKVIEATSEQRAKVEADCQEIIRKRREKRVSILIKLCVSIAVAAAVIGVCCLIWEPKDVFSVIGCGLTILIVLFASGGVRK